MKPLPRRAFLGAELPADEEPFTPAGARIAAVAPGGMADRAGVRAGDTIVTLADLPVRSFAELSAALRRAGAMSSTVIRFARGAEVHAGTVAVAACPLEEVEGVGVGYGELAVAGVRLRTIATRVPEPRAMVLLIPDAACESVEAESPLADVAHGLARAGLDTLRFDRRGVGDSEGGPCGELDFAADLADTAAALELARTRARERELPLVVFGHGAGGLIAALLAGEHRVRGVITCGAPGSQRAVRELTEGAAQTGWGGRTAAYHAQIGALDPAALWAKVSAPVLILRCEHDWLVPPDDQGPIASAAAGPASVVDLRGLDHVLGRHESREASLRDYGAGPFDPAVVQAAVDWIDRL